jgi:hypothetical protein
MRNPPQSTKDDLIAAMIETRQGIVAVAQACPPEARDDVFLGTWSLKDMLAHLIGWDYTNMAAVSNVLAGQIPIFYAHHDRDWKTYNALLVTQYKQDDFSALLSAAGNSHQTMTDFLRTIPASEFTKDHSVRFRGYIVTIARLLQAEIDDEKVHCAQLSQYVEKCTV